MTAATVAAAAYNNIGRPPLTCWSKDQWSPHQDVSRWPPPAQRSHRQRSTRLTSWSKCQWSPTSYQPPVWRARGSQRRGGERWQAGRGAGRARDWSKVQWSPLEDGGDSRGIATRLQGQQGGVGGGAGAGAGVGVAGAGGGGGGSFNRVSFPPPPAASAASAAGLGGRSGFQARGAASTVSRPAVAAATVGSTGPKDLSGAPVEVGGGRAPWFAIRNSRESFFMCRGVTCATCCSTADPSISRTLCLRGAGQILVETSLIAVRPRSKRCNANGS